MATRPVQEPREGTVSASAQELNLSLVLTICQYMEHTMIADAIKYDLVSSEDESTTKGVWMNILTTHFTINEGFWTRPEQLLSEGGKAALLTAHVVRGQSGHRSVFLVVECGALGDERQDSTRIEATDQLKRHLGSIVGRHRKFGAAGVGKVVRFYELLDGKDLVDFDDDGSIYHLDRQCRSVCDKLDFLQRNHPQLQVVHLFTIAVG